MFSQHLSKVQLQEVVLFRDYENQNESERTGGDPNQNMLFQMAITLKLSTSDPMLVKPAFERR